jgi:hypothetical protein
MEPWDTISVDFIVKPPESDGYDTIMNVVDSVTKRTHFIPTSSEILLISSLKRFSSKEVKSSQYGEM